LRLIQVSTPSGTVKEWTGRVGNNPRIRMLLLHGGSGATHDYFEAFDSYFPGEGMATLLGTVQYLYCPKGSHMAMYDDQATYFAGLIKFVKDVDQDHF
jgi:proline iminopeptidase